ncbi:phosphotransferase [Rhizobium sp. KVB221]|uniref:Phosphotransferase n=1 Tax=Rhizobium setariae TaxID=2801340 RepID=A0A936YMB0_9HYPH|nr:aminoglycoside phosphotransferase family protein [Rhizobium setariae]MBL0371357.1 phosphotransferase [Rhizobium setariae]
MTALPHDVAVAARHWRLENLWQIADTASSMVWRARTTDAKPVVLKALKPAGTEERAGFDFLAWRNGAGSVRLLDRSGDMGLLEDGGERTLEEFHARHGETPSNEILATVLKHMHGPGAAPPPASFVPLELRFSSLFEVAANASSSDLDELLAWAAAHARALLDSQASIKPLHGDLHHGNVISADETHWLAIDPKGLVGDPAYDAANIFGNPLGRRDLICDPDRIDALATTLGAAVGCDRNKILRFAAAHAALSLCWLREDGLSTRSPMAQERMMLARQIRKMIG